MFDIKLDRTHQMLQPYCHSARKPTRERDLTGGAAIRTLL